MNSPSTRRRFGVVGGGIAGLAAAHRLQQLAPDAEVRLIEATDRLGGPLRTHHGGEVVIEEGADSFLIDPPDAVELCRSLGLADELLPTSPRHRRAEVVFDGRLAPIPDEFVLMQPRRLSAVLRSPVLSWRGKLRLLTEPFRGAPRGASDPDYDESIESFAVRRLGREAYQRLVQPLAAGIYVGDGAQLSLAATMPQFLAAERDHGGLWRAARAARRAAASAARVPVAAGEASDARGSGARYGAFVTLRHGLSRLIESLAAALPVNAVTLGSPVIRLERAGERTWKALLASGGAELFDGLVVATPAPQTAAMLQSVEPTLAGLVGRIECASSAVVLLLYRTEQLSRPLTSFGFVVPQREGRSLVAASFPGVKFAARGHGSWTPVRAFFGGVLHPGLVDLADQELIALAERELTALLGVMGRPAEARVTRWRLAMPQYRVGHRQLAAEIDRRVGALPRLALAGNAYHGVGIPHCIRSGRTAAQSIAS